MIEQNAITNPQLIKLETVAHKVAMGKSTILAWEATGKFPRALRLSPTIRVWLQEDVDRWIFDQHSKMIGSSTTDQS